MKNMEEIMAKANEMSIKDIDSLIEKLKWLRMELYEEAYVNVRLVIGRQIMSQIQEETGFECYNEAGLHIIVIPRELYSEELEEGLRKKYED